MAELPDLTVFADILTRKYKGKVLQEIDISVSKKLNVSVDELKSTLNGKVLDGVYREGKTLQLKFSGNQVLGIHLMLKGELVALISEGRPKFQIIAFKFKNGEGFAVIDMLRQATATLNPAHSDVPDALNLTNEYFTELLSKKRIGVKSLLMNQKVIRGIGNSYADEILYDANVSPLSTANAIPSPQVSKIYKSVKKVLENAIENISEANGDDLKGELKDFMNIHGSQINLTAKGEEIKSVKIAGRTAYYTDSQILYT